MAVRVLLAAALVVTGAWLARAPRREERLLTLARRPVTSSARQRLQRLTASAVGRIGIGPATRRRQARERLSAIQALGALAAELEAGQPPVEALRRAGGDPCVWPATLGSLAMDGDVAHGLTIDGVRFPVLVSLAACWRVAAGTGAGLSASVARLASTTRAAEDVRVNLEGQLAGPRATARMLSVLPLVGVAFGMLLGSDPLSWLLTTTPGRLCAVAGALLTAAGTWWTARIAARVERLL